MEKDAQFAVIGHPNEGKSSVLSTLAEDDTVAVSAYPGETVVCQRFPVKINGRKVLEFIDTPGFQNPKHVLKWMQDSGLTDDVLLDAFLDTFKANSDYQHDCELMKPLRDGAGVIYVVDCSRPLLEEDEAEMEILRLINKPRMAVINYKELDREDLEEWKLAFRRHFNVIREFNAHQARFAERMALLETLKAIHQDWEPYLNEAIRSFQLDWKYRKERVAELIVDFLNDTLNHKISKCYTRDSDVDYIQSLSRESYRKDLSQKERQLFLEIKRLYRHHVFNFELPSHSILNEDLFAEKNWQLLGLSQKQLLLAASGTGAGVGAVLDLAAAGLSFGVFTAAGVVLGGGSAYLKGKDLAKVKIKHLSLGGSQVTIGPNRNPQFPYIMLDRALLFYGEIRDRAHGKREKHDRSSHVGEGKWKQNVDLLKAVAGLQSNRQKSKDEAMELLLNVIRELL